MTTRALRTILCCSVSVSGSGLWAVAAGALTHHFTVSKIGAAVAVLGAVLVFTGPADTSEESR